MVLRKPSAMMYNDVIDRYCSSLAAEQVVQTDLPLVHAVRLHRIAAHMASVFGYSSRKPADLSTGSIELLIESFRCQLQDLRSHVQLYDSSIRKTPLSLPCLISRSRAMHRECPQIREKKQADV